jgi:hypothetical protein
MTAALVAATGGFMAQGPALKTATRQAAVALAVRTAATETPRRIIMMMTGGKPTSRDVNVKWNHWNHW